MIRILNEEEVRRIITLDLSADAPVSELGAIINGEAAGRTNDNQTTVCDLTGVGVQDTMIAIKTMAAAAEQNMGITIS
jgi:ornithine cyclodeaminase